MRVTAVEFHLAKSPGRGNKCEQHQKRGKCKKSSHKGNFSFRFSIGSNPKIGRQSNPLSQHLESLMKLRLIRLQEKC